MVISVQVILNIILYYGDIQDKFKLSSDHQVKDLRTIINDKFVPYNSQHLSLIVGLDGEEI